jgi:hypothetical protein
MPAARGRSSTSNDLRYAQGFQKFKPFQPFQSLKSIPLASDGLNCLTACAQYSLHPCAICDGLCFGLLGFAGRARTKRAQIIVGINAGTMAVVPTEFDSVVSHSFNSK